MATKMIQLRINREVLVNGKLVRINDAIYMTEAEYDSKSEQEIEEIIQARIDAWVYKMENPPEYIPPSLAILKKQYLELEDELVKIYFSILERANPLPVLIVLRDRVQQKLNILNAKIEELEGE